MPIVKAGMVISTLHDWELHAGPKKPNQWVDGRSAKETAHAWLEGKGELLPREIAVVLAGSKYFGSVINWSAEPEAKLKFDSFAGEPRNSDLVLHLEDIHGQYLMAVDAKADESFGDTISKTLAAAKARLKKNVRSKGVARIEQIKEAILGISENKEEPEGEIRYQLLTACAGALCEAERYTYSRALMLVQEFITDKTKDKNHKRNSDDLDSFSNRLSRGKYSKIETGKIYGPIVVPGIPLIKNTVALFLGKVTRNLRKSED